MKHFKEITEVIVNKNHSLYLLTYDGGKIKCELPINVDDITEGIIQVISGDERFILVCKDGSMKSLDPYSDLRLCDYYDGEYQVINNGKWIIPDEWFKRIDSYEFL